MRGGHIPGAANVPWARAVREDGTFKSSEELKTIYEGEAGLNEDEDVIAYCRIGSVRAIPGSCSPTSSATTRSATTTARGPSGATWYAHPSSARGFWTGRTV